MIELRALELGDMETIRLWRNGAMDTLRTPYLLTREQQEDWYQGTICNRHGRTRYWAVIGEIPGLPGVEPDDRQREFVGYGGIENIQWENRRGEISVLIGPQYRGRGYGREAVRAFLDQAFRFLNLDTVWGECYYTTGAVDFWKSLQPDWYCVEPRTKYYAGHSWPSYRFQFHRESFVSNGELVREEANGARV